MNKNDVYIVGVLRWRENFALTCDLLSQNKNCLLWYDIHFHAYAMKSHTITYWWIIFWEVITHNISRALFSIGGSFQAIKCRAIKDSFLIGAVAFWPWVQWGLSKYAN